MKNYCLNSIVAPQCISINSDNRFIQQNQLVSFTNKCWELYSPRLKKISDDYLSAGRSEFKKSNSYIIEKVIESNLTLLNLSLSATSDKSLHYTFRFKEDVVLFIETYLYLDEENHTYIELFHTDKLIFSGHYNVQSGLSFISNEIKKLLSNNQVFFNSNDSSFDTYPLNCD